MNATTTKHTCDGPKFGRLTDGCPRCEELKAGAPARQQAWRKNYATLTRPTYQRHVCNSNCMAICTANDW